MNAMRAISEDVREDILVTGATGFVGAHLVQTLLARGQRPRCISRRAASVHGIECTVVPEYGDAFDWQSHLQGIRVVVHCAARVHMMGAQTPEQEALYQQTNVRDTLHLARQAAKAGVERFIFLSSIKVNGEATPVDVPYSEQSEACPLDAYGRSKLAAEQGLLALAEETGMAVTILRPPLVYGSGVKANFESMLKWTRRALPLPLGAIANRRSLIYVGNLTHLICTCMTHPAARNQIFLVSDGDDVSTSTLLRRCAQALNRPSRLLPVPAAWLTIAARLLGREQAAQRLCASLVIDSRKARTLLDWTPPYTMQQGLQATAQSFLHPKLR